ncbi:50S ribosomal protein L9 [Patulibacter americanus]|uniref:50S ribosomal protein L9 n=1 Tax=Patulibacter americanus TaxID=588672 RepID=UPI0003B44DDC|nr:50S ribosomal protein L9 [Patulibacter americanus]
MPEAILLADVPQLGSKGAVVEVSKGYLRNYLLPRKLAAPATKALLEDAQRVAAAHSRQRAEAVGLAREQADTLTNTVLTIQHQTGEDGRLFGSVTNQDIADAIKEARGIDVDKRNVRLAEPIRSTGTFVVDVELTEGVIANVKTMVVTER